jgi:hypothetical protein
MGVEDGQVLLGQGFEVVAHPEAKDVFHGGVIIKTAQTRLECCLDGGGWVLFPPSYIGQPKAKQLLGGEL